MHRPPCPPRADHLLVCQKMANGEDFSRGTPAPGPRNPAALVGAGDSEDRPSVAGTVLGDHAPGQPIHGQGRGHCPKSGLWYDETRPTFSDALALARKELWAQQETTFCRSAQEPDTIKVPRQFIERLTNVVCYAV